MAQVKGSKKGSARRRGENSETGDDVRTDHFDQIGSSSSQIVKDAALLLDDEIAAGIVAAKQMQTRFQEERRIDPGDFKEALARFQGDAHSVIHLLDAQGEGLRSDENREIFSRYMNNAHSLIDLAVEMVNMGSEVANHLIQQSNLFKKNEPGSADEPGAS